MKREIKFRGKEKCSGLWRCGFLLFDGEKYYIIQTIQGTLVKWIVDTNTIGQFTGLHDKNGKEIYEGDIVRYWREDTRCINPDCDAFNRIYDSFIKKVEGVVSYEDGMFVCEDYTPLCWCGFQNLEELRNELNVTEEDEWMDCDGNVIDESVLGIEVIGNIYDNKDL